MYPQDEKILEDIVLTRNLSERTEILYKQIIEKYTQYHQKPLTELIKEAEIEEEQRIRWKNRKLRKRLITFRNYLYDTYMTSTAKMNYSKILTIYRHYEIELQPLPPISEKQTPKTIIQFKDLPNKEIIGKALKLANPVHSSLILFMASTGASMIDSLNLKIEDLLFSVEEYYKTDDVYKMIDELKDKDNIIPMFKIKRNKTGKVYYTFCTNEAFKSICFYLLKRKSLRISDRLFKITQLHAMQLFREVNDLLGLGTVGESGYVRFRSHMLRKFHASALYNDGMSMDDVNALQGKSKNKTDSSYFMEDPYKLKLSYMSHMDCLIIGGDVNVVFDSYSDLLKRVSELEDIVNSYVGNDTLKIIKDFIDDD